VRKSPPIWKLVQRPAPPITMTRTVVAKVGLRMEQEEDDGESNAIHAIRAFTVVVTSRKSCLLNPQTRDALSNFTFLAEGRKTADGWRREVSMRTKSRSDLLSLAQQQCFPPAN